MLTLHGGAWLAVLALVRAAWPLGVGDVSAKP